MYCPVIRKRTKGYEMIILYRILEEYRIQGKKATSHPTPLAKLISQMARRRYPIWLQLARASHVMISYSHIHFPFHPFTSVESTLVHHGRISCSPKAAAPLFHPSYFSWFSTGCLCSYKLHAINICIIYLFFATI